MLLFSSHLVSNNFTLILESILCDHKKFYNFKNSEYSIAWEEKWTLSKFCYMNFEKHIAKWHRLKKSFNLRTPLKETILTHLLIDRLRVDYWLPGYRRTTHTFKGDYTDLFAYKCLGFLFFPSIIQIKYQRTERKVTQ